MEDQRSYIMVTRKKGKNVNASELPPFPSGPQLHDGATTSQVGPPPFSNPSGNIRTNTPRGVLY
jgi:hypothetical protein